MVFQFESEMAGVCGVLFAVWGVWGVGCGVFRRGQWKNRCEGWRGEERGNDVDMEKSSEDVAVVALGF